LKRVERLIGRITADCSRPDWAVFAVSNLLSGMVVVVLLSIFGA